MKHILSKLIFLFFINTSFAQVSMVQYDCKEIGWSIQFPESWSVTVLDQMAEAPYENMKYPIFFQKDQSNIFQSTLTPLEISGFEEWKGQLNSQYEILLNTYTQEGIKFDTTTKSEIINKVNFEIIEILIYNSDKDIILKQEYYATFINGYEFSATLSYNNPESKSILKTALSESTFKK